MPTLMPRPSATATDHPVTRAGRGDATWTSAARALPARRPAMPPSSERMADSARNWRRMSRRDAPSDLRIPISRVRSVTLISMIFMITMPPTTIPIATTAGTTVKMTRVSLPQNAISPSPVSTVKSSSCPGREGVVLHHHERRGDTEDEDVAHGTVAPLHVRHRRRPAGLERDRLRVGHGALHVGDVLGRDDRPPLDLLPCFVVDEPDLDRVPTDLKGVDPDDRARDALAHVGVHALDHGHYRDEEPDRHDDPEQREERAELVAPRGLEGLEDGFGEGHGLQT